MPESELQQYWLSSAVQLTAKLENCLGEWTIRRYILFLIRQCAKLQWHIEHGNQIAHLGPGSEDFSKRPPPKKVAKTESGSVLVPHILQSSVEIMYGHRHRGSHSYRS